MKESPLGIGIIGAGFGANVQLPAFKSLPGVKVVGIAARTQAAAKPAADANGIICFDSAQELIASADIHAVSIATPQSAHRDIVTAALKAGKHVLCEKPLGRDAKEAEELCLLAEALGVVHMVDFEFRELQAWQWLKKKVDSMEGQIRHAEFRWILGSWADPARPWFWHCDRNLGGGVLQSHGSHAFDAIEWFFGPIRRLVARTQIAIPTRLDEVNKKRTVTAEDTAHLLLECSGGKTVTLDLSLTSPCGTGQWIEVHTTKQTLVVGTTETFRYGRNVRAWEGNLHEDTLREVSLPDEGKEEDKRIPLVRLLAGRFVEAIHQKNLDVSPSFRHGLRAQVLREAALQSAEKGMWVRV
jgi:predicted dehydrogenase